MRDLKARAEESPLWKHCASLHSGEEQQFKLSLLAKHQTAFERQIAESVHITHGKRDITLNSKAEWMGSSIPRLTIEVKDRVMQVDHDGSKLEPRPASTKRGLKDGGHQVKKRTTTLLHGLTTCKGDQGGLVDRESQHAPQ